jgi:serine/threonine-protein kinase
VAQQRQKRVLVEDLLQNYQKQLAKTVPAEHACLLLAEAADALDFLNRRQHDIGGQRVSIPHGNVKPSNLLLVGDTLKVTDIGLSRTLAARLEVSARTGPLGYCAPEMFAGQMSSQTDQFALAVTYCKLRTGSLPFGERPLTAEAGYLRSQPDLSKLQDAERPIIARALQSVPVDRWPSCREFAEGLIKELARTGRGSGSSLVRRRQRSAVRKKPAMSI